MVISELCSCHVRPRTDSALPRVLANISGNEGRLTPKLVADFSKDYGAQRSEQEIYSQGGKRGRQRRDRFCGGEEDWQPGPPSACV